MFISIRKIEVATHRTDELKNPGNPGNEMQLSIFRTVGRTFFYTSYAKKASGEYWDVVEGKKIPKRLWTSEMKAYCTKKAKEAPRPPFIFKITIFGWIWLVACFATLGYIIYEANKPPLPKSEDVIAMEQPLEAGDLFFGHFEEYKEAEKLGRIASGTGFGWFRIVKVENDIYYVAKSTEMSKGHQPKEQLNNTDFETEVTPTKIKEKGSYSVRLLSTDGNTEFYLDDKKRTDN
ncbi:hypothetical protein [Sinomicrobium sp. M5D2P17]